MRPLLVDAPGQTWKPPPQNLPLPTASTVGSATGRHGPPSALHSHPQGGAQARSADTAASS